MSRTRLSIVLSLVAALTLSASAEKPAPAKPATPPPAASPVAAPRPGDETKALAPMVGSFTFVGLVHKDAYGPGSPEMPSKGSQKCAWILEGFWLACDIVDIAGTGKAAMKWSGHFVLGWDVGAKAYRAQGNDSWGNAYNQSAHFDGKKLVLESVTDTVMMGTPIKFRFSFDLGDPRSLKFTDERSVKGGPFVLGEEGVFKKK